MFLDYKMRELEVHNVTNYQSEQIADLIRSRGFVEEEITQEHPGFKETEEYFEKMKSKMSPEEYEKLMEEINELMAPAKKTYDDAMLDGKDETVFFDPEEKKKYEDYKAQQRKERDEQRKKEAEEVAEAGEAQQGEEAQQTQDTPQGEGEAKKDL